MNKNFLITTSVSVWVAFTIFLTFPTIYSNYILPLYIDPNCSGFSCVDLFMTVYFYMWGFYFIPLFIGAVINLVLGIKLSNKIFSLFIYWITYTLLVAIFVFVLRDFFPQFGF